LAVWLALYFDSSVEFWLNLQRSYEEEVATEKTKLLKEKIIPYKEKKENFKHAPPLSAKSLRKMLKNTWKVSDFPTVNKLRMLRKPDKT
jgi:hypothetical protein